MMKHVLTFLVLLATLTAAGTAWAIETRNFNAVLQPAAAGPENGFGTVKFRQPEDENKIVYLKVRVEGLLPNHGYYLQRATDAAVDDDCTGTNWLTLGRGLVPVAIETDDTGQGRAVLFRDLAAVPEGTRFDIHFRVVDAITNAVVLVSDCHQFTVLQ
jgi:hypothetical protein